ncbi:MAG: DNA polymerase [Syntrophales bacterium]|jgi:DNA polymerase I-like protein with 3'-5' exonuclease and polymerase domains|nr:DNA polymerase [Syntrophales bacterium]
MNIVDLLKEAGIEVTNKSPSSHGSDYESPCPGCEGTNRFQVWNNDGDNQNFYCKKCGKKGFIIEYLVCFHGMSYSDACAYAGKNPQSKSSVRNRKTGKSKDARKHKSPSSSPSSQWQSKASAVVESSVDRMWEGLYVNVPLGITADRGLKEKIIKKARLGWIPQNYYQNREDWGLPPEIKEDGTPKKLMIPAGLVIPNYIENGIERIRIRLFNPEDNHRYHVVSGSSMSPMILPGNIERIMVVESELDALLIHQEAGDLIEVIAMGSSEVKPDSVLREKLAKAKVILVSLDNDEAGSKASLWWKEQFSNSLRWPVSKGKDHTEAYLNGENLRKWVMAGILKSGIEIKAIISQTPMSIVISNVPETSESCVIIQDANTLQKVLAEFMAESSIGLHCETSGTDPYTDRIQHIIITAKDKPMTVIDFAAFESKADDLKPFRELLNLSSEKVMYDAKTSLKFLRTAGLSIRGRIFDIMLAAQIVSSEVPGEKKKKKEKRFALENIARQYLAENDPIPHIAFNPGDDKISRLVNHAKALLPLKEIFILELDKSDLMNVARLEFACIASVAEMELNGMLLNTDRLQELRGSYELELDQYVTAVKAELGPINLNSPEQIMATLKAKGVNIPNTKSETLIGFSTQYPFMKALVGYRKISTRLPTIKSFIKHINPATGRVHPHYSQIGSPTGRFSCSEPNAQGVPHEKRFRSCFIAAPGCKLIIGDYSQIELRIVAEISDDQRMIQAYNNRADLHKLTASFLANKPIDQITKDERNSAKAVNFGLIFGMGADGLAASARNDYGVYMTTEQASIFKDRFFAAYQGVSRWLQSIQQTDSLEARTLSGRRRLWTEPPKITERFNTPIQGTSADITKAALALLIRKIKVIKAKIIGCVYDEVILEVPTDKADEAAEILEKTMIEAGQIYLKKIPVEVEVAKADDWSGK